MLVPLIRTHAVLPLFTEWTPELSSIVIHPLFTCRNTVLWVLRVEPIDVDLASSQLPIYATVRHNPGGNLDQPWP